MNPGFHFPWIEAAITGFALWTARDLVNAWLHSPLDRGGWLAWLLWCVPVAWTMVGFRGTAGRRLPGMPAPARSAPPQVRAGFLAGALGCAVAASGSDLNVLGHLGLAVALAAWARPPRPGAVWVWLVTAVAWMPVFGWLTGGTFGAALPLVRVVCVAVGAAVAVLPTTRGPALSS